MPRHMGAGSGEATMHRTRLTTAPLIGALALIAILHEAGLPKGVVNMVIGDGDVGRAIVAHPGVDGISFTGSQAVGAGVVTVGNQSGAIDLFAHPNAKNGDGFIAQKAN